MILCMFDLLVKLSGDNSRTPFDKSMPPLSFTDHFMYITSSNIVAFKIVGFDGTSFIFNEIYITISNLFIEFLTLF